MEFELIKRLRSLAIIVLAGAAFQSSAQQGSAKQSNPPRIDPQLQIYRETSPKINDLVHTKLDVRFDYGKRYLYGKAWITLTPHFYPTDSLRLDAKWMDIKNVSVVSAGRMVPLKYKYQDSLQLAIKLDRVYKDGEKYTVFVDYTSKPEHVKVKGSAAITDAKGLYFINPDGKDKDKPVQIWTQGETEGSSVWFPTIDKPNQKTTEEITMTVPGKYVTLSNGALVSQKNNADGTRTDTWKMDLPHSPYLFMMAVGDFRIYKDKWRNKEVSYYLEPKYAPYAKQIFGHTPEMIEFFSKKLGVDFPWNKYAQIVVRDYVSGAMENTTATLHGEFVQATPRELLDESPGEDVIAHELFHQWLGDYVTTESWSNLTVNESFADFSEMLWEEYKYGKDAGDEVNYKAMESYLNSPEAYSKNLVRFHYKDKEDMFDVVTYQKGGRILNMLRNYLGDAAFFKGVNLYLKQNAFKNAEAQQLRLAMEAVSGKDLNWFFNQWYYNSGHPLLVVNYHWDEATRTEQVILNQAQHTDPFILPMAIDIYSGGKKERHTIWMRTKSDTLSFKLSAKPDLVNVDADKVLLTQKSDNKSLSEYAYQYFNAPLYLDRLEAINASKSAQQDPLARKVLLAALKDKYFGLRIKAIKAIDLKDSEMRQAAIPVLNELAKSDPKTLVQAEAITSLAMLRDPSYKEFFHQAIKSQSYSVQGAALTGIALLDSAEGYHLAKSLQSDSRGDLKKAVIAVYGRSGETADLGFFAKSFDEGGVQGKVDLMPGYVNILAKINDTEMIKKRIGEFKEIGLQYKSYGLDQYVISLLQGLVDKKMAQMSSADNVSRKQLREQVDFILSSIEEIKSASGKS